MIVIVNKIDADCGDLCRDGDQTSNTLWLINNVEIYANRFPLRNLFIILVANISSKNEKIQVANSQTGSYPMVAK